MASINIKVKSDFAQASKDLKSFGNVTEAEKKRIQKYLDSFKGESIDKFIDENRRLGAGMKANKGDISAIITQQKALEKQSINLISKGLDPEDKAIEKLNDEYNRLQKEYDQTIAKNKAMENASKAASVALLAIGAAAVGAAAVSSKMALEYTKSLANINTMIDVTADEMSNLNDEMTGVSNEFAIQKSELSAGVYQALSAGAKDLSQAMDIVTKSAKLGKGALIDTASSVDIVTTAMNAYGDDVVDASLATDVFFNIIKQGKINGEQLSQSIGQSITLFSAAKISVEELGAGIATLTKVGVKSSEATTQLNGVVNAFLKPSEALASAMHDVGFESGSALLESEGLKGALEFLSTATGGSVDKMAELIPNIRGMRGALALASNDMKTYNDVALSFNDVSGSANEAMLKQTDGFAKNAFTVEQSIIIFKNLSESIGQKLIPTLGSAASALNEFMMDSDNLNKTLEIVGLSLAGVTAGLATFLLLSKGAAAIQALSAAFVALNLAMKANPAIFIASAVTAVLIPAIILLVKNWDKVSVVIQTSLQVLGQAFKMLGVNIKTSWVVAINTLKLAWLSLGAIIVDKVLGGVQMFLDLASKIPFVGDKFASLSSTVGETKEAFNALADEAKNNTVAVIQGAIDEREEVKKTTEENIKNINLESKERLEALKVQEEANEEATQAVIKSGEEEVVATVNTEENKLAVEKSYSSKSSAIAEKANDDKEKDSAEMVENITKNIEEALSQIESLATKSSFTFQDLGDVITSIADSSESKILGVVGKLVSSISGMIEEIKEKEEEFQQSLADSFVDTYSQILSNRKALIDQTYDLEAERISDTYNLELETIKNTLSEAELLQLQSLGIIEETKAEANETARREALQAAADAGIVAAAQIKAINDVYDARETAIEDQATAEAEAATATAQYQYDNAVFQRNLSYAQASISAQEAMASLPWYTSSADKEALASNYQSILSSIASTPLPPNPSAQTGTPMGGFTVPENTGSSRADNTSINVSPNEVVSVTPRGEGGNSQNIIVQIARETIFNVINDGLGSGDIIINTDNIQSA